MRLIDADALKEEMAWDLAETMRMSEMHKTDMAVRVMNKIDEANTIDAAPVVRCKDCWKRGNEMHCPMCYDECFYDEDDGNDWVTHDQTEDDGFCHVGAKMDGGASDGSDA